MKDFIDTALNGLFIIALPIFNACSRTDSEVLFSPDGKLEVSFSLTSDGEPSYRATFNGADIIALSIHGFEMKYSKSLDKGFSIASIARSEINEIWALVLGENDSISSNCRQMTVYMSRGI